MSKLLERARAAFDRVAELGGTGVWETDLVVIDLGKTNITDDDLVLFLDFPFVQILNLDDTKITDDGLRHLHKLDRLESLSLVNTGVTQDGVAKLQSELPEAEIRREAVRDSVMDPFTGRAMEL